ncbi:C10 family peptidase [Zobellia uliginosa]|uniref:C10 family peptidase n=1 Tax=Zobellia uliginosa TaxID=143224 RepID=UPI0026E3F52C|nr:C10 family peptidase [Zobellia uliginosa]MDO6517789.1 C10 family peptidase [Zobellia uliginosa]
MKNNLLSFIWTVCLSLMFLSCSEEDLDDQIKLENNGSNKHFVDFKRAESIAIEIEFEIYHKDASGRQGVMMKSKKKVSGATSIPDTKGVPVCHIFNYSEGGFVLLSADDRTEPLLAYSNEGRFELDPESLPFGPRGWLDGVSEHIAELRLSTNNETDSINMDLWKVSTIENVLARTGRTSNLTSKNEPCYDPKNDCHLENQCNAPPPKIIGPLLQSTWGQRDGYNNLAPYKNCGDTNNGRALTGCISVAMAQVMKYHEEPSSRYDFSLMPMTTGSHETSRLIRDIGNTVNMKYDCDNSWAYPWLVDGGMGAYSYGGAIHEEFNHNRVLSDLNRNRPVILEGKEKPLVSFNFDHLWHVWVCDGYKRLSYCHEGILYQWLYLHMNWGWNGNDNGWYAFNNWNPDGTTLNHRMRMTRNIKP